VCAELESTRLECSGEPAAGSSPGLLRGGPEPREKPAKRISLAWSGSSRARGKRAARRRRCRGRRGLRDPPVAPGCVCRARAGSGEGAAEAGSVCLQVRGFAFTWPWVSNWEGLGEPRRASRCPQERELPRVTRWCPEHRLAGLLLRPGCCKQPRSHRFSLAVAWAQFGRALSGLANAHPGGCWAVPAPDVSSASSPWSPGMSPAVPGPGGGLSPPGAGDIAGGSVKAPKGSLASW